MTKKDRDEVSHERAERDTTKGDAAGGPPTIEESSPPSAGLHEEIALLRAEVAELNGKWLRALADLDNYRKRVERERRQWSEAAREDVLSSVLEVVDSFDRAFECGEAGLPPPGDTFRQGIELILAKLREVLTKNGVRPMDTCGLAFDPALHEAVGHVESKDHVPDEIIAEERKGYMVGDRVLRCARVIVAK